MQRPVVPDNERLRLDALRRLAILDSPVEERFDRITRMARNMFDVPIALVSLVDENRQWFKSCCGLPVLETPRDISFCGHAILGEELFVVEDAAQDPRFSDNPLVTGEPHIRFYAGHPLEVGNGLKLGTLCIIDSKPRIFSPRDQALLADLASMVESELQAVQRATIDELTGITNRRGFMLLAEKILKYAFRVKHPAALLFLDLNHFKQINDKFGHDIGDDALQHMAELLCRVFRDADIFARLGGDEFVVLLPGTSGENCHRIKERLYQATNDFNSNSGKPYQLSCSLGIVVYDATMPPDLDQLLRQADEEMYSCKVQR
ncbi:sensor domain-containing diguanylate cyclase [Aeromonas allosaccharophila]|uniref:sensor domain-containing diguanylate cyclase n=1 Tax=Aeromonas allosaccharophila TaxID=656 RepID=UPI0013CD328F|nr:sensor domain-containing diguanylate cyclase [Aeromonas allosaccharophila]WDO03066.1 sensor domain-containing diguanylate cyclase [Aeromonas allosaccharophila]